MDLQTWADVRKDSKRGVLHKREELPPPPRCVTVAELSAHLGVHYLVARKIILKAIDEGSVRVHELYGRGGPKAYEWVRNKAPSGSR